MAVLLLTVLEVVARLGVSRANVYNLMARGELRSVRVGGSRRVHVDVLDRFVAELDDSGPAGAHARHPRMLEPRRRLPVS